MWRATWRGARAHKLRLILTALAVVIGVAFVSGTLVLTDTLHRAFSDLFAQADRHTSVVVRSRASVVAPTSGTADDAPVPATLLDKVRAVPGVREAVGDVTGFAQLVRPDGKSVTTTGAPTLGVAWTDSKAFAPGALQSGRPPRRASEVAIDSSTAHRQKIGLGDAVTVVVQGPRQRARVVGTFRFHATGNLAGATITAFTAPTAQQLLLKPGYYTRLTIAAADGVSERRLARRVEAVLPPGFQAVTGTTVRTENASAITEGLRFFGRFLLVFAVIALFVGSFIIWNTFSMLVAQRTRELALLRAIGASRGQVTRSVLAEACAVGAVGAAAGLGAGLVLASGLRMFLAAIGMDLPSGGLVLRTSTVVWSFLVGITVTLIAALFPARRAGRVPPVAAMRDDVALPARSLRRRAVVGAVATTVGAILLDLGLTHATRQPLAVVGAGAVLVFLGVTALSPMLSRPVVRVLGAPLPRLFGIAGKLGNENALRNPRRTATTAAALMIGLAFVSLASVLAASFTASAFRLVDESLNADYIVATKPYLPFSPQVARDLKQVRGVQEVAALRGGQARIAGQLALMTALPPGAEAMLNLVVSSGSAAALAHNGLLVDAEVATKRGWRVGDEVPVVFAATGPTRLRIGGTYAKNSLAGQYLVATTTYDKHFSARLDTVVLVKQVKGTNTVTLRRGLQSVVWRYPGVHVRDQGQLKSDYRRSINQLLSLVFGLLFLAIIIAALGIVNTLTLSVIERTREIGLLRAVGMSRRQLRRMVRLESVTISVFGALLGVGVGVAFGWAVVSALHDQGIGVLRIPIPQLSLYLLLAAVVGVLAAVWPARRAARMDVLRAISTE